MILLLNDGKTVVDLKYADSVSVTIRATGTIPKTILTINFRNKSVEEKFYVYTETAIKLACYLAMMKDSNSVEDIDMLIAKLSASEEK